MLSVSEKLSTTPTVRAVMLIRANTLARGFSGIRLETLELIIDFLNRASIQSYPKREALGASGEPGSAGPFRLRSHWRRRSRVCRRGTAGAEALAKAELSPVVLKAKKDSRSQRHNRHDRRRPA